MMYIDCIIAEPLVDFFFQFRNVNRTTRVNEHFYFHNLLLVPGAAKLQQTESEDKEKKELLTIIAMDISINVQLFFNDLKRCLFCSFINNSFLPTMHTVN
jgi:hypothetical protein